VALNNLHLLTNLGFWLFIASTQGQGVLLSGKALA
jgi:hypothetical protein